MYLKEFEQINVLPPQPKRRCTINYARWLPDFLEDLKKMRNQSNSDLEQFNKGYFTVNKTDHPFSSMGVDQAHKQNKKVVKVDVGAIGILENETALLKWAVVGPIISDFLNQAEQDLPNSKKPPKHHKDTDLYGKNFRKDQNSFLGALVEYGNPFCEEEPMLVQIVSKQVLDKNATSLAKRAREIVLNQFDSFSNDRLRNGTASLYQNITNNNSPLFRSKNIVATSKLKQRITNLEADHRLYAILFVACQTRDGDLDNFFTHANHAYPVSLSEYGKLRKCFAKSDFLQCSNDIVKPSLSPPNVEVKIIVSAAFLNINKPKKSETFGQYCSEEIPMESATTFR